MSLTMNINDDDSPAIKRLKEVAREAKLSSNIFDINPTNFFQSILETSSQLDSLTNGSYDNDDDYDDDVLDFSNPEISDTSLSMSFSDSINENNEFINNKELEENLGSSMFNQVNKALRRNDNMENLPPSVRRQSADQSTNPIHIIESFQMKNTINNIEKRYKAEVDRLLKSLSTEKDNFRNLEISKQAYQELKKKSEDKLTLKEFICMRIEEMRVLPQLEVQKITLNLQQTQKALEDSLVHNQIQQQELDRLKRQIEYMNDSHQREVSELMEVTKKLHAQIESTHQLQNDIVSKASRFDVVEPEAKGLREECSSLRLALESQNHTLLILQQSESEVRSQLTDLQRTLEMRKLDLSYLQSELRDARGKVDEKTKIAEAAESRLLMAESKASELTDKLMSLQLTTRTESESRLDREVAKLREDSKSEIESIRQNTKEMADRETRVLREVKVSLEAAVDNYRRRIDELSRELSENTMEYVHRLGERDREISELKSEIKLRAYELTSLGTAFEERCGQIRQLEIEKDLLQEQHHAYQSAMVRLEEEYRSEKSTWQTEVKVLHTRLGGMEARQKEREEFLKSDSRSRLGDGSGAGNGFAPNDSVPSAEGTHGNSSSSSSHSDNSRKQGYVIALQAALEKSKQREAKLVRQVQEVRSLLLSPSAGGGGGSSGKDSQSGSKNYLIQRLKELEGECITANHHIDELEQKLAVMESDLLDAQRLAAEQEELAISARERLRAVLSQRGEVNALRNVLEAYMAESETKYEDDYESEGEGGEVKKSDGIDISQIVSTLQQRFEENNDSQQLSPRSLGLGYNTSNNNAGRARESNESNNSGGAANAISSSSDLMYSSDEYSSHLQEGTGMDRNPTEDVDNTLPRSDSNKESKMSSVDSPFGLSQEEMLKMVQHRGATMDKAKWHKKEILPIVHVPR